MRTFLVIALATWALVATFATRSTRGGVEVAAAKRGAAIAEALR